MVSRGLVLKSPFNKDEISTPSILLSDNFVAQEDYFNAKYSLESIINNYKGDDDIIRIAEDKLQIVVELENEEQIKQDNFQNEESDIDFMIDDMDEFNLNLIEDEDPNDNKK